MQKSYFSLLFTYLALPFFISIISFSQVFSAYLPGVCVAFCLIHLTVVAVNKSGKNFFLKYIVLSWTVSSKRNGNEFMDNTVEGT